MSRAQEAVAQRTVDWRDVALWLGVFFGGVQVILAFVALVWEHRASFEVQSIGNNIGVDLGGLIASLGNVLNAWPSLIPGLQAGAILLFLLAGSRALAFPDDADLKSANGSTAQFQRYWTAFWVCLFLLYALKTIVALRLGPSADALTSLSPHIENGLDVLSSMYIFLCYFVLTTPTSGDLSSRQRLLWAGVRIAWWGVAGALIIGGWMLPLEPSTAGEPRFYFAALLGLIASIALGMFVGRLESPFLSLAKWSLTALYGYAALQMAAPLAGRDPGLNAMLIVLMFPLKILLFVEVRRVLEKGWLTHHMFAARSLGDSMAKTRAQFLARALPARR